MRAWFTYAVLLPMLWGCKKGKDPGEVVPPEPELKKEEVMPNLIGSPYHMAEWYGVSGKDTTFLNEDPVYGAYMKVIFLMFVDDKWVDYYFGHSIPNTVFLGKAQTFDLDVFYFRPFGMTYRWDEEEGTMIITWNRKPNDLPAIFPEGVTLKLDKKGYKRFNTYMEARSAGTSGTMRFHYVHEGKTYTLVLKQMWNYAPGNMPKHNLYVVF